MKHKALQYTLLFLCFLSCARQPQKSSEGFVVEVPEWYNTDSLRAEYLYSEGVKVAALAEDRTEALPYFEKVLEIDSLHAPSHYQIGDMVLDDDPERALRHGAIVYAADSTNVDYLGFFGYALVSNRELQKARTVYERLVKLEPHNVYNYQMLASLYRANNMPYMALSLLDSAEYKLGRRVDILEQKLNLLYSLNLYDRAIVELEKEVGNHPRKVEYKTMLGYLYMQTEQDSLAESSFHSALALSPQDKNGLLGLATLYKQKGLEEEFLQTLKTLFLSDELMPYEAVEIFEADVIEDKEFMRRNFFTINSLINSLYLKYPDDVGVERCYGKHLIASGEVERGLDVFKKIVRDYNYYPDEDLYMVLGGEDYLGRKDSVMHYLDLSIQHHPNNSEPLVRKAYELLSVGNKESEAEAQKLFKKALKLAKNPEDKSDIYGVLANLELNPDKAAKLWEKALKNNPNNAMALNNWAYMLVDSPKQLSRALEMSTKACVLEPTNPTYLDTKAWILFLMGNIEEAKRIMRQAISLDSEGDSTLLLHYGDILAAEGDSFMAEIYYKRALEAGEDRELIEAKIEALKQ
ncbi:MAG: hypothetical protein IJZ09_00810 [Tidjanibacter sp.]|nr:hypothetical protein [Tidjanibacter sp.]